jgi:AcrR family transcriptional regulator
MPKIAAATVKEHHEQVLARLVDAAEEILRTQGAGALTAGGVTSSAGIARNSIYRYVDSVDDLRGLVLARYLPRWQRAVDEDLSGYSEPSARVLAWVRANLEQASANGHGWLMAVARISRLDAGLQGELDRAHNARDFLGEGLDDLGLANVPIRAEMIRSVVDAGFRSLDAGEDLDAVIRLALSAAEAIIASTPTRWGWRPGDLR